MRFATKAIRAGQNPDPTTGAIATPVYQAANFIFEDIGKPHNYEYSRSANPTRTALEQCLAALEEATYGLTFASGMAAVDAVLSLLKPGDHVVSAGCIYGGTFRLFEQVYKPRGISFSYVDGTNNTSFANAITSTTKLVWIETPANPLLELIDVEAVADITHKKGAKLVADNTFATPYFQRPLNQGADIVVHSTTKYISGHSDVVGGAVLTNTPELFEQVKFYQNAAGAIPGPWDCWLTLRGLKTLAVRMKQHAQNAQVIAEYLENDPRVSNVIYPGLKSHSQYGLAKKQMDGFGAIITFSLPGGDKQVRKLFKALNIFQFAESLGGVESLLCHPASMSHATMTTQERLQIGITNGTLRLSVGIEDVNDLLADIESGLKNI